MVILIKRQTLEDLILLLIINAHGIALYLLYSLHKEATNQQIIIGNFIEYDHLSTSHFPNEFYLKTIVFNNEISMKFIKIKVNLTKEFVYNDMNNYFSINEYQTYVNITTKSVVTLFFDEKPNNFKVIGIINIQNSDIYFNIMPNNNHPNQKWKSLSLDLNPHLISLRNYDAIFNQKDSIRILIENKEYFLDGTLYKKHEDSTGETSNSNRHLNIYLSDIIAQVELNYGQINASIISIKFNNHDKNKQYVFKNQIYSINYLEK
jgi:hypothetical protein